VDANYTISYVGGHVTVTKATPTVTITNTTNPTGVGAGSLVLTATVTGVAGDLAPTGTLTWTVTKPGGTTCSSSTTTLSGSGSNSTATCTFSSPGVGNYTATASYAGDTNYAGPTATAHKFGLLLGDSSATLKAAADDYSIDASSAGSGNPTTPTFEVTVATTITSVSGFVTVPYTTGTAATATFTLGTGQSTFANTSPTADVCTIYANVNGGASCTNPLNVSIAANAYLDLQADRLASSATFNGWWIVTYQQ
jgi:hypothetical protein